jgi:hypothetical protein
MRVYVQAMPSGEHILQKNTCIISQALAFILLDFARSAGNGYSGIGVDECIWSRTFWTDNVS